MQGYKPELRNFEIVLVLDVLSFRAGEAPNFAGTILLPLLLRSDMRFPEDEYPRKARLFWVRHEHFRGLAQFRGLRCCGKIEQARWVAWQLWPSSFLV